ncbi:hypothetical protein ACFLQ2_00220 [archaeon]
MAKGGKKRDIRGAVPRKGQTVLDIKTNVDALKNPRANIVCTATKTIHIAAKENEKVNGKTIPNLPLLLGKNIQRHKRDAEVLTETFGLVSTLAGKNGLTPAQKLSLLATVRKEMKSAGNNKHLFEKAIEALK